MNLSEDEEEKENQSEDLVSEMNSICELEQQMADNSNLEKVFGDLTNSNGRDTTEKEKSKAKKSKKKVNI